jgi:hypothetical protein
MLRALLGGCAPWARHLGGCSTSTRRLNGGNTLPRVLRGCSPGLRNGRGWTVAPAGNKGHMNVRGSATPDEQRLQALGSATGGALNVDAESDDLPRDRRLCRESESGRSEPS